MANRTFEALIESLETVLSNFTWGDTGKGIGTAQGVLANAKQELIDSKQQGTIHMTARAVDDDFVYEECVGVRTYLDGPFTGYAMPTSQGYHVFIIEQPCDPEIHTDLRMVWSDHADDLEEALQMLKSRFVSNAKMPRDSANDDDETTENAHDLGHNPCADCMMRERCDVVFDDSLRPDERRDCATYMHGDDDA